ncbi:hypothetical protein CEUSTIGMA_g1830.t1 [Chlamydomonas eustigma]|uniref:RRM domain-containing protein n=1 Tax=Chlamydomonas eustigma TaxID=1157962 RepID=A0A250WUS0_9CHLO|nr:hypothetical protein CEUSTIGMA_g1830.t1 [Chlamydomonas eustigma]|eukprot:GAX74382.1 hypothetical protein CEUSTIGMA_g1830.t1 [Chlamydomonas eustigma]
MSVPYDYSAAPYHHSAPSADANPYAPPSSYPPPNYSQPPYNGGSQSSYAPAPSYGGYPSYGGPTAYNAPTDEVRTIFITGFPPDVKERELNNLLRFLPGYEASQMNWKDSNAQGFALFSSGALARSACDSVTQLYFDETTVLRCEMARKNMYIKEDPTIKRPRTSGMYVPPGVSAPPPASYAPPPMPSRAPAAYGGGSSLGYSGSGSGGSYGMGAAGDNPPCNTLFIGNLGDAVSEQELRSLFAAGHGFKFLKVIHGARSTTCFVEYEDIPSATAMHSANQGAVLNSSDRGPLRVQFAKNPYGKKRDITGALIDTLPRDDRAPGTH